MTLTELYTALTSLQGFANKVTYRQWETGQAPALPFICYLVNGSDNLIADNHVYYKIEQVDIELYTRTKSPATEELIEQMLYDNGLAWEKTETYISSEKCYQISYSIEV